MYSNQMGLDGDRLYYDGTAMIVSLTLINASSMLTLVRSSTDRS